MSNLIGSGRLGLTSEWAIQKLEENCDRFRKKLQQGFVVEKIVSTQLSADNGFMSFVYKCEVNFKNSDEQLLYCLKEPTAERMDEILGFDFYPILIDLHERECQFYELFSNVKGLIIPKVIDLKRLTSEDKKGYIFMEFAGQGRSRSIPLNESLTLEQMFSVAEQIARLHAFALKNKSLWSGDRFKSVNIVATNADECEQVFGRLIGGLRTFCDDALLEKVEELREVLHNYQLYEFVVFKAHLEAGLPSILSHGDLWANNVLFKVDLNDKLTSEIGGLVDFQAINSGNPAQDLVRIMLMNMSTEARQNAEPKVFKFYYEKLGEYLKEIDGPPVPFTLDQYYEAARPYFLYQLALAMFIAAHSFMDEKKHGERAVFVERLRGGIIDACKNVDIWKNIIEKHNFKNS